jgi:hypothetical protein
MTVSTLRPLGFGEILDGAFTLYRRNFLLFTGTSLLLTLALVVVAVVVGGTGGAMASVIPGAMSAAVVLLAMVAISAMGMVLCAALTWQAAHSYLGAPVSLGDGMSAGGRSAMTLVGASILCGFAFGAMMAGIFLAATLVNVVVMSIGIGFLATLVSVATTLAVLAGFFFVAALFFAVVPAVVLEEKGPLDAVGRSVELARGALPRITGMMVVTMLITYLPLLAVLVLTGAFSDALNPAAAQASGAGGAALVAPLLTWLVLVLATPFLLSVIVLLYYDRRVRTEGLDVQMLTDQIALAGA